MGTSGEKNGGRRTNIQQLTDGRAIYRQIRDFYRERIVSGQIGEGEPLPSVRTLAKRLGVNPNTVRRAYLELEQAGLMQTTPGKGCYAARTSHAARQTADAQHELRHAVLELLFWGQPADDIDDMVKNILYGEKMT